MGQLPEHVADGLGDDEELDLELVVDVVHDDLERVELVGLGAANLPACREGGLELVCQLAAALAVAMGMMLVAFVLILLNRFCDGPDGAVARATAPTDFGGFLDIVFDFIFYAMVPFGFALDDPANALAACFLVVSFFGTAVSFLAFAVMAERRGQF